MQRQRKPTHYSDDDRPQKLKVKSQRDKQRRKSALPMTTPNDEEMLIAGFGNFTLRSENSDNYPNMFATQTTHARAAFRTTEVSMKFSPPLASQSKSTQSNNRRSSTTATSRAVPSLSAKQIPSSPRATRNKNCDNPLAHTNRYSNKRSEVSPQKTRNNHNQSPKKHRDSYESDNIDNVSDSDASYTPKKEKYRKSRDKNRYNTNAISIVVEDDTEPEDQTEDEYENEETESQEEDQPDSGVDEETDNGDEETDNEDEETDNEDERNFLNSGFKLPKSLGISEKGILEIESCKQNNVVYIARSMDQENGMTRIKVGRTNDWKRREKEYKSCRLEIWFACPVLDPVHVEKMVHSAVAYEYYSRVSKISYIKSMSQFQEVKCPCGHRSSKHNHDVFYTTRRDDHTWLKNLIIALQHKDFRDAEALMGEERGKRRRI